MTLLLEGMAAGLAQVAYDIPQNREAIDDGRAGILTPVGDHRALAEALHALATKGGLARSYGRLARARSEAAYDIEQVATRTMDAYEEAMSRRAGMSSVR